MTALANIDAGRVVRIESKLPVENEPHLLGVIEAVETTSLNLVVAGSPSSKWQQRELFIEGVGKGRAFRLQTPPATFERGLPWQCRVEFGEDTFSVEGKVHARATFDRRCAFMLADSRATGGSVVPAVLIIGLVLDCSLNGFTAAFDDESARRLRLDRSLFVNLGGSHNPVELALVELTKLERDARKKTGVIAAMRFADLDEETRPRIEADIGRRLLAMNGLG